MEALEVNRAACSNQVCAFNKHISEHSVVFPQEQIDITWNIWHLWISPLHTSGYRLKKASLCGAHNELLIKLWGEATKAETSEYNAMVECQVREERGDKALYRFRSSGDRVSYRVDSSRMAQERRVEGR